GRDRRWSDGACPPGNGRRGVAAAGSAEEFVHVAPAPLLARLQRLHDRVPGGLVMRGGVPRRGGVAAPDVTAGQAYPQVHPPAVLRSVILAAVRGAWGALRGRVPQVLALLRGDG